MINGQDSLKLTNKEKEIPRLLYRFRFLTKHQFKKLFNHKDQRLIERWLKHLLKLNIIEKLQTDEDIKGGIPAIYCLGAQSTAPLKGQEGVLEKYLLKVTGEKDLSQRFKDHCLFIANLCIEFKKYAVVQKVFFYTRRDLAVFAFSLTPAPDAYIAVEENGKAVNRYFIDLIDDRTPRYALRKRIKDYTSYFISNEWEEKTGHGFPTVMVICPDENTKKYLNGFIRGVLRDEGVEITFLLAIKDEVRTEGIKSDIWEEIA